jgi:hypothetical protein
VQKYTHLNKNIFWKVTSTPKLVFLKDTASPLIVADLERVPEVKASRSGEMTSCFRTLWVFTLHTLTDQYNNVLEVSISRGLTRWIEDHMHSTRKGTSHIFVAHRISKCKKAHASAEDLILPSAIDMCTKILGESGANKLKTIPLSNDTMRRIQDMSEDITCSSRYIQKIAITHCSLMNPQMWHTIHSNGLCQTRVG